MPKYRLALFRVAFVGWLISGRLFVEEAYFRVVYFRVALCLHGIFPGGFFPGGFCWVAYFLDPYGNILPKNRFFAVRRCTNNHLAYRNFVQNLICRQTTYQKVKFSGDSFQFIDIVKHLKERFYYNSTYMTYVTIEKPTKRSQLSRHMSI